MPSKLSEPPASESPSARPCLLPCVPRGRKTQVSSMQTAHVTAVPRGPDVVGDPSMRIGTQRTDLGQLDAGPLQESGGRPDPDGHDHEVGLATAAVPPHPGHSAVLDLQLGDLRTSGRPPRRRCRSAGVHADRTSPPRVTDMPPAARQHGDPQPAAQRRLGRISTPMYPAPTTTTRAPGVDLLEAVDPRRPVVQGLDRAHPVVRRPVRPQRPVRHHGRGAGRHDQLVVLDHVTPCSS